TGLWSTDGTAARTTKLAPICPLDCAGLLSFPAVAAGGSLYFTAYDPATGVELWRSDGTPGGTALVDDIAPGTVDSLPVPGGELGGLVLFSAAGATGSRALWAT